MNEEKLRGKKLGVFIRFCNRSRGDGVFDDTEGAIEALFFKGFRPSQLGAMC